MSGDDFGGMVFVFIVFILAGVGVVHIASDYRHFNDIAKQCEQQGYIQNETTRIQCKVEK